MTKSTVFVYVYVYVNIFEKTLFGPQLKFQCLMNFVYLGTGQNLWGSRAGTIDRGAKTFFRKNLGGENFFTTKSGNPRFHSSKKAIFENQRVIIVRSMLSLFIGV